MQCTLVTRRPSLSDIHTDALINIFEKVNLADVPAVASTCKRFQQVVADETLKRKIIHDEIRRLSADNYVLDFEGDVLSSNAGRIDAILAEAKVRISPTALAPLKVPQALFYDACNDGHAELVKLLLASGRVDPAARDCYALVCACTRGRESVVRLLLNEPQVTPAARYGEAFRAASNNGHTCVVDLLQAHCA